MPSFGAPLDNTVDEKVTEAQVLESELTGLPDPTNKKVDVIISKKESRDSWFNHEVRYTWNEKSPSGETLFERKQVTVTTSKDNKVVTTRTKYDPKEGEHILTTTYFPDKKMSVNFRSRQTGLIGPSYYFNYRNNYEEAYVVHDDKGRDVWRSFKLNLELAFMRIEDSFKDGFKSIFLDERPRCSYWQARDRHEEMSERYEPIGSNMYHYKSR